MGRKTKIIEEEFDKDGNLTRRTITEEDDSEPLKVLPQPSDVPWPTYPNRGPWNPGLPWTHYYEPQWYSVTTTTNPNMYLTYDDKGNAIWVPVKKKDEDGPDEGLTPSKV